MGGQDHEALELAELEAEYQSRQPSGVSLDVGSAGGPLRFETEQGARAFASYLSESANIEARAFRTDTPQGQAAGFLWSLRIAEGFSFAANFLFTLKHHKIHVDDISGMGRDKLLTHFRNHLRAASMQDGRWRNNPCGHGDLAWLSKVSGIPTGRLRAAITTAEEEFYQRQVMERRVSLITAALSGIGFVLAALTSSPTSGFALTLLAATVLFLLFGITRKTSSG